MDEPDVTRERDAKRRAEIDRIGIRVKAERTARSWSLRRLASESGLSASLLSAVENGRIVPTVGSLFAISDALEVSAPSLFPPSRQSRPTPESGEGADRLREPPASASDSHSTAGADESTGASLPPMSHHLAAGESAPGTQPTGRTDDRLPVGGQAPTRPRRAPLARPIRRASPRVAPAGPSSGESTATPGGREPGVADRPSGSADVADWSGGASGDAAVGPRRTAERQPMPGIMVLAPVERRRIPLSDGSVWTLVHREPGDAVVILEGRLSPEAMVPATFTVRLGPTRVVVQRGRLKFESGFRDVELQEGAEAAVDAGVPFRISVARAGGPDSNAPTPTVPTTVFVILEGGWDGRLL